MDKKLVKKDFLSESQILVGIQNKSPKEIIGFKGAMVFYNVFGESIYTVNITDDNTFKPNETARMMYPVDYNKLKEEDIRFIDTDTAKMKFEFIPEVILYTDGSKLEMPK